MPGKRKPNKGLLKRVRFTSKGKVKKHKCGTSHLLSHMTSKRKRHLRKPNLMPEGLARKYRRMAGMM